MNNTILTILTLSASGSVLALILLAMRPLWKDKVSKTFQYYIWLLVLLRLAVPLSFDGSIMDRIISHTKAPVASTLDDHTGGPTQWDIVQQGDEQKAVGETPETALNGTGELNPTLPMVPETARFNIWMFVTEHLTAIWLLGALVHFSWFVVAYVRFSQRIKRTSVQPHPMNQDVFVKLRGNTNIQLACNPYIDTPMLIGFLSPRIIIPHLAFVSNGMKSELQHILRHELTHYRRRDLLYKWFVVLVGSFHWFNPLMILVRREINRTCELSCDEAVIRSLDIAQRQDYGETLLAIAANKRLPTGVVTTTMCEEKRQLKERLESIMTYKRKSLFMVAFSLVLALLFAGCSVALGAASADNQIPSDGATQSPAATDTPVISTSPDVNATQSPVAGTPDASTSPAVMPTPTPKATNTPGAPVGTPTNNQSKNTKTPTANSPVLEAYSAVLQNQAEFYSADSKKNLKLNDFLSNKELYDTVFKATRFAVIDMDGDKVPEVVLELSVGGEPQFHEVLHSVNGTVNGFLIYYRGLEGLKADGTFGFSSGAADYGWGKLKFGSSSYETDKLAYTEASQSGISYFINDKTVNKQDFDSFSKEQDGKNDVVWYAFSQENIEAELSGK